MNKTLTVTTLAIITVTSISAAYADNIKNADTMPYILSTNQFPAGKATFVRHTIRIKMPPESKGISEIAIDVPSGVTVKNDITVHNTANQQIEVNSSVNDSRITLDFPQGMVAQEVIEIDLNKVKLPRTYPLLLYRVYAKLVDSKTELSIGVAEVRTRI